MPHILFILFILSKIIPLSNAREDSRLKPRLGQEARVNPRRILAWYAPAARSDPTVLTAPSPILTKPGPRTTFY